MKYCINFASNNFRNAQIINTITAKIVGGFDKVIEFSPEDIDLEFFTKNRKILNEKKGAGYWLWKPYIIKNMLNAANDGDFIFYCDSGALFISSIKPIIQNLEKEQKWLIGFNIGAEGAIEKRYTKRDAFVLLNCDTAYYKNSRQIMGTFLLIKKCKSAEAFVDEWLRYAQDPRILTDLENACGLENDEEYIDHRHDQSIFSLLCKKNDVLIMPDPSIFIPFQKSKDIRADQFIYLHRNKRRNIKDGSLFIEPFRLYLIVHMKMLKTKYLSKIKNYLE